MSKKKGLKTRDVSKEHFSSGVKLHEPKVSRLVVRMLQGKDLLASDVETGKSDPVAFLWLGPLQEQVDVNDDSRNGGKYNFLLTKVCPTTIDPIWNEDLLFELDILSLTSLLELKCVIFIRDEDQIEDRGISYEDLGMIEFPLQEIIQQGKALKNSIVLSATWYDLKKTIGMRRIEGKIKLTISLIFANEDYEMIANQCISTTVNQSQTLLGGSGSGNSNGGLGPLVKSFLTTNNNSNKSPTKPMSVNTSQGNMSVLSQRPKSARLNNLNTIASSVDTSNANNHNNDNNNNSNNNGNKEAKKRPASANNALLPTNHHHSMIDTPASRRYQQPNQNDEEEEEREEEEQQQEQRAEDRIILEEKEEEGEEEYLPPIYEDSDQQQQDQDQETEIKDNQEEQSHSKAKKRSKSLSNKPELIKQYGDLTNELIEDQYPELEVVEEAREEQQQQQQEEETELLIIPKVTSQSNIKKKDNQSNSNAPNSSSSSSLLKRETIEDGLFDQVPIGDEGSNDPNPLTTTTTTMSKNKNTNKDPIVDMNKKKEKIPPLSTTNSTKPKVDKNNHDKDQKKEEEDQQEGVEVEVAQGNATFVIRVLRELKEQKQSFQQEISQLTK
jgi:hypothetical protein